MANSNPYDQLPQAASFELTSEDVREGAELEKPQLSGIFGAGGEDIAPAGVERVPGGHAQLRGDLL